MTESSWGESEAPPPRKKGIPTWLWFCGGGCLLAVILAIVTGVWAITQLKVALDPEKQWPKVAEILPYDERPPELSLKWGSSFPLDAFVFIDSRGFVEILYRFGEGDSHEAREQLMNPEFEGGFMGAGKREDLKAGTIRVQGRDLTVLRFRQTDGKHEGADESSDRPEAGAGASILVELSQPEAGRPIILQIVRGGSNDPITDEEVQKFLAPFHVGPDR